MGRTVYAPLDDLQVTNDADQDIWELTAGADNKLRLLGWELTSAAIASEAVQLRLIRGTAAGSGGAVVTEILADEDDGAITAALVTLATTPGTDGSLIQTFRWEQLGPVGMVYTPEMAITVQGGDRLKLNLETALTGTTEWDGWVCWEEI